jgi:hypothetical protein
VDDAALTVFANAVDHYDIRHNAQQGYLQLRLLGAWNEGVFERFVIDYRGVLSQLRAQGGVTHLLVDATAFDIQPQEIADRFTALIGGTSRREDQRTACVAPSLVNRIQSRPGGNLVNARYFRAVTDATDWLFSDEA